MKDAQEVDYNQIDESKSVLNWQRRLLPLMVLMTVGMTLFFLVASMIQLKSLNAAIQDSPEANLSHLVQSQTKSVSEREDVNLRALIILEANIIERRHHEANVALMARIWTRYMGFIIGMALSMVGSAFVLGRLSSNSNSLVGSGGGFSLNLQSASPGLIMITLGVLMMIVTITNHPRINIIDKAVYVAPMNGFNKATSASGVDLAPPPIPDWQPDPTNN